MELRLGFFERSAYMLHWDVGYGCKFKNYMGGGRHRGDVGTMENFWALQITQKMEFCSFFVLQHNKKNSVLSKIPMKWKKISKNWK